MAGNLGALTVSLGLDAADYTRGLTKAEKDAYAFGEAIGTGIRNAATTAASALAALGLSAGGAVAAFSKLIDGIGQFADLSDKTGASAEALASFSVAAATSGVSMDKVASATNTLTRNLVGVGDETKAAGAALKALGIPLEEFKALKPEEQIDRLSKTFATFEDGAGKSATAMALFGKSGADVLPFLKTLEEQGGRQVILTQELIDQADAYGDRQAKAKAELELYAQVLAAQAIPMLTAFTGALTDTAKEILGVGQGATDLKSNTAVADFAENAVRVLGFIVDAADGVIRVFQGVGTAIGAAAAAAGALLTGDLTAAKSIVTSGIEDIEKIAQRPLFSDKLNKRIADARAEAAKVTTPAPRPELSFNGPAKKTRGSNKAAQEAKAQLAADLADIKNAQDAITDGYRNQERILQAERSAGLKDESAYYAEKVRLMDATAAAQEDGLRKSIARLEQEKLSGKDAIDNARKIAAEQAKLVKVQEDAATSARVAAIEHEAAMRRIEAALLSARQAAQDFFDTTNRGYARDLAGVGQGQQQRDFSAAIQQIEDKYHQQRQQLQNQRAQSELQGTFGPEAQKQFDAQIAIINEFQKKSVDSYTTYYQSLQALQKDWSVGATEALRNYANDASNVAKQVEGAFTDGFKGLEDALAEFVTTGKADFKSLADSIIKDIARIVIKQNITGPLAQALSGALGGGSNVSRANSMGGNSLDNLLGLTNAFGTGGGGGFWSWLGGLFGRASGGMVSPNSMYRVNENGPEMLDYQGKQYLMTGTGSGRVTSASKVGGTVVQNFTVGDVATQSQVRNAVQISQRQSAAALSRSSRYGGVAA